LKLKLGLGSNLGVGYEAARLAAGVWKKAETEGFWVALGFWVEAPFWRGGVEPLSMKDSHAESIWLLISFDLTGFPHIGHSTMVAVEEFAGLRGNCTSTAWKLERRTR
jgi:hypothetical protein